MRPLRPSPRLKRDDKYLIPVFVGADTDAKPAHNIELKSFSEDSSVITQNDSRDRVRETRKIVLPDSVKREREE